MRPIFLLLTAVTLAAAPLKDPALQRYFEAEVEKLSKLPEFETRDDWERARKEYVPQLAEMLGVPPASAKGDLKPVITGRIEHDDFVVEKIQFQSLPGLYVTANFYLPKKIEKPLPTILYVCGHAMVKSDGVSFGNKTAYQHHGEWFARNGYTCLTLDTIQLGEIEGLHHGTYREGMWWWNSRGYTPAGVEAWNCIRALDYLETRPEVDKTKFGVTGRSGGGAYSWWITALDERIKVSAPVAGITDLKNHVVDGVVEGHCDCMFFVNTYRWDYPLLAALAAPRPLLIANSDKDPIFPLDGVVRTHTKVAEIYKLYGAEEKLGLLITEGPHKDTQDLQLPVFRWFNRHLKGEDPVIEMAATKLFEPAELKVFKKLPEDERTSRIHETFVPSYELPPVPTGSVESRRTELKRLLLEKVFRGWPESPAALKMESERVDHGEGRDVRKITFDSQEHARLRAGLVMPGGKPDRVRLHVMTEEEEPKLFQTSLAREIIDEDPEAAALFLIVRGTGSAHPEGEERVAVQIRRRYNLVGQTLDGMRVWDIRRAVALLQELPETKGLPIHASGEGISGMNVLFAALFTPELKVIEMRGQPVRQEEMPEYLNMLRWTHPQEVRECLAADQKVVERAAWAQ